MKKSEIWGKQLSKNDQKKINGKGYGGACLGQWSPCGLGTPPCCSGLMCVSSGGPYGDRYCMYAGPGNS